MVTDSGRALGVRGLQRQHQRSVAGTDRQRTQIMHARARGVTMRACRCVVGRSSIMCARAHAKPVETCLAACTRSSTNGSSGRRAGARQALLTCHCCHERKSTPDALRARFGPGFYKRPGQFTTTPPVLTRGELLFGGARRKCTNTCPLFNEK